MVPTLLERLPPVHSKRFLPCEVFPRKVSNAAYSGVAKLSRVIAVKVAGETGGCVSYLPLQGLAV